MHFILSLIAGALLCNAIPHLTSGLRGEQFPSPFAKPPGRGNSGPEVNFLWGSFNLFLGLLLFRHNGVAFAIGFLALGLPLARNFGKVRGTPPAP